MSVINTNISSMQAQNSMRSNGLNLSTAMERLSSGIRINSAKDDAAGLAISTRMTASIRGISAAIRNANDGISLTQTAEGSLSQISDNLQRIRELAVQSANTGNNASDRAAMNNEATQLIAEIDRVASNTTYNGIALLDGTFQDQNLQVGAGNGSNDRIAISISSAKSSALGVGSNSSYATEVAGAATTAALVAGGLSINAVAVGATVADGVSYAGDEASGIAIAAAINAVSGTSGVTATVGETTLAAGTMTEAGFATALDAGDVLINGVDIGGIAEAGSFAERGSQMAAAINAVSDQTGVTAEFSTDDGGVTLTAADGRNITVTFADSTVLEDTTGINGTAGTGDVDDEDQVAGVLTTRSSVTLTSAGSDGITIGDIDGVSAAAAGLTVGYTATTSTAGAGVSSIDLSTASGSQDALTTLDSAINTVTDIRAAMGAYQNRLTASISNLETTSMNLSASRSRILDTDYAKETTNLAKSQIIQQAATAMLAQANQSGQSVLALLK
jgi:flagellin